MLAPDEADPADIRLALLAAGSSPPPADSPRSLRCSRSSGVLPSSAPAAPADDGVTYVAPGVLPTDPPLPYDAAMLRCLARMRAWSRSLACRLAPSPKPSPPWAAAASADSRRILLCNRSSGVVSTTSATRSSPMLPKLVTVAVEAPCITLDRSRSSGVVVLVLPPRSSPPAGGAPAALWDSLALTLSELSSPRPPLPPVRDGPWMVTPGALLETLDVLDATEADRPPLPLPAEYDA
mmetsp:Transcript_32669/g.96294  ORF Transcript_32669/g.96294 Transcript_32669/m.96294 type:complete len:237 (-) Transcript_32669:704-1414(-)